MKSNLALILSELHLHEIESLRLLLRGGSIVDLHRLNLKEATSIHRLLKVNGFDVEDKKDLKRLMQLRNESAHFLSDQLGMDVPDWIYSLESVIPIFEAASEWDTSDIFIQNRQRLCCSLLKVMNVINHLDAHDRLFKRAIDQRDLFRIVQSSLKRKLNEMQDAIGISFEFSSGKKSRQSLITKLLAKEKHMASQVFDRIRFKIVTESVEDIVRVLNEMMKRFLPFNYIIPGETVNKLLDIVPIIKEDSTLSEKFKKSLELHSDFFPDQDIPRWKDRSRRNEFSGESYRDINFVFDFPVHLERYYCEISRRANVLDDVVFVLVECQILDQESERLNESGENAHAAYKARQLVSVRDRLLGQI